MPYVTDDVFRGVGKRTGERCGCPVQKSLRCSEMGTKVSVLNKKNMDLLLS